MKCLLIICLGLPLGAQSLSAAEELATAPVYGVTECLFRGPPQRPTDTPARDVDFAVVFRHASGSPEHKVLGFWDGDGAGGLSGNVFKVRFCPTQPGQWLLAEVLSNRRELRGQHQG